MLYKENEKTDKTLLSQEHLSLLMDKNIFLLKRDLADKINSLLSSCIQSIRTEMLSFEANLPNELLISQAKITKGENYLSFPWSILDYPRIFNKEAIFAIRTFCWWGNNFSITLHLSGPYLNQFLEIIFSKWEQLSSSGFMICINSEQWQHHLENNNYEAIKLCTNDASYYKEMAKQNGFLKLCRVLPLNNWEQLQNFSSETSSILFQLLTEKD